MGLRLDASFWARLFCGRAPRRADGGAEARSRVGEGAGTEARLRVGEAAGAVPCVGGHRVDSVFLDELFSGSCKRCFATVIHGR